MPGAPRGPLRPDGRLAAGSGLLRHPGWDGVVSGAEEPVHLAVHDLGHLLWLPLSRGQPATIGIPHDTGIPHHAPAVTRQ